MNGDYQRLFARTTIDLGRTAAADQPTDARIAQHHSVNDPQLSALLFQYGRYLLISSSRPGTQPATLQGIWNDQIAPPWRSKYTHLSLCEIPNTIRPLAAARARLCLSLEGNGCG